MIKQSYQVVYKEGLEELKNKEKEQFHFKYLTRDYIFDVKKEKFIPDDLSDKEKILALHYLISSNNFKINNELITFKELPTGNIYFPSIRARVHQPLIEKFGKVPQEFIKKAVSINGEIIGETSIKFNVFPEVFYIFELIPEDEEFPAEVKIFFNKTTVNIFQIEDIVIISEEITNHLTGE